MSSRFEEQHKKNKYYVETKHVTELTHRSLVLIMAGGKGSHIQRAWGFMRAEIGEMVEIIPAQQRRGDDWYKGTADSVFQNIDIIRRHAPDYVIILGGDHIYAMDYSKMLMHHVESHADLTIGCIEVPREDAREFGVMSVDAEWKITRFTEKPADPEPTPSDPAMSIASMGIYVFSTEFLLKKLIEDADDEASDHDFGKNIIPSSIEDSRVLAYPFRSENGQPAYWRDVGSVDSYWQANMELCEVSPELNLYDRDWPIWTYQTHNPPAKFIFDDEGRRGQAIDSLVSAGCIISGARVKRSIIFFSTTIGTCTHVKDSVILPKVLIGENCRISNAIIDKGCYIEDGMIIGEDLEEDAKRFHVTPGGVVLVTSAMLNQNYHKTT
jgi:glucose-1-phosphate adenylyltransferase